MILIGCIPVLHSGQLVCRSFMVTSSSSRMTLSCSVGK
jgi:hypothetical protein